MPQYKQSFWIIDAGTGDIGAAKRAQIAKAALALNENDNIVLSTSAGGYTTTERPEIALVVPADYDPTALRVAVEEALATEQLSVKAYLQGDVRYYDLGQTELVNIAAATKVVDLEATRKAIDEISAIPPQPVSTEHLDVANTLRSLITRASNVSPSQSAEGFSVTAERYQRLKAARGDAIKAEIDGLSKTFDALSRETNTNAATAIMVASGLITIGKAMYTLYTAVQSAGSVAALVSTLLAAVGGIAGVAAIIAIIAVTFGLAWVLLKDARNVLLFVNGKVSDIKFVEDYIKNGERDTVVESMPAADPSPPSKPGAFPCGFYIYKKYTIFDSSTISEPFPPGEPEPRIPIGFYGSCMGITFISSGQKFSVGMDCPNTILGGTNSIRVTSGTAKTAANLAVDSGNETESITVGRMKFTASRAAKLGFTNYGICYIE